MLKTTLLLLASCCALTAALEGGARIQDKFSLGHGRSLLDAPEPAAEALSTSSPLSTGRRKLQQAACDFGGNCINVSNSCSVPLTVVLRYYSVESEWVTERFGPVMPEEAIRVAETFNRYIYFHVRTENGDTVLNTPFQFEFENETLFFFEVNIGDTRKNYTHNFGCKA